MNTTPDPLARERAIMESHGWDHGTAARAVKLARETIADVRANGWQRMEPGETIFAVVARIADESRGTGIPEHLASIFLTESEREAFDAEVATDDPEYPDWLTERCEEKADKLTDALNAVVRAEFPDLPGSFHYGWNDGSFDFMYVEDAVLPDDND